MILLIFICAVITVLSATQWFGRAAGFSAAAACGFSIAFFALEPAFSLEIANPMDRGTLVVYGMTSFFLVLRVPKRDTTIADATVWDAKPRVKASRIPMAHLLRAAVADARLGDVEIDVDPSMQVACSPREMALILGAILRAGVPDVPPTRIAAYGGHMPGQSRVWIALQYKPWPSEPRALHIGMRPDQCTRLEIGDTDHVVTWFDNGFERVFQISITGGHVPY